MNADSENIRNEFYSSLSDYIKRCRDFHLISGNGNRDLVTGRKISDRDMRKLLNDETKVRVRIVCKLSSNPDAIDDFFSSHFHKLALGTLLETPEEIYAIAMQDGPYIPPVPSDEVVLASRDETLRALAEWRFKWNDLDERCIRLADWIYDHVQSRPGLIAARNLTVPALVAARDQTEPSRPMPTPEEMWQMANPNLIAPPACSLKTK